MNKINDTGYIIAIKKEGKRFERQNSTKVNKNKVTLE
jgi:hypothetical protein